MIIGVTIYGTLFTYSATETIFELHYEQKWFQDGCFICCCCQLLRLCSFS